MKERTERIAGGKTARLLRVFGPFMLLLAGLIMANLAKQALNTNGNPTDPSAMTVEASSSNSEPMAETSPTAVAAAVAGVDLDPAEPTGSATTPVPTLEADRVARLVGPPPASSFPTSSVVQFYWRAADPLPEGQLYALYLLSDETELLIGTFDEPNLGNSFQARFTPAEAAVRQGSYYWEVRLQGNDKKEVLGRSEQRIISFFEAG